MIVSHKHKFIFIKTKKTAGTSIEIALSGICGPADILTPLSNEDEDFRRKHLTVGAQNYYVPLQRYTSRDWMRLIVKHKRTVFHSHLRASYAKQYLSSNIWNSYYKFCFERNPWDRIVSHYYWNGGPEKYGSLDAYLISRDLRLLVGKQMYCNNSGNVLVDHIYRYEDLDHALVQISEKLGLDEQLKMPAYRAKGGIRKASYDYSGLYSPAARELVAKLYADEIALMGYQF